MVKVETRINEENQEEIVISDFSSFKELVEEINILRIKFGITPNNPKKIIITRPISVLEANISYPIDFSNVVFEENVSFIHTKFNNSVIFTNAIFNKETTFNLSHFLGGQTFFVRTTFNSISGFCESKFIKNISFFKAVFNDATFFSNSKFIDIEFLDFSAIFNSKAEFDFTTFNGDGISFDNAIFNKYSSFCYCKFYNSISFWDTQFNHFIDFSSASFKIPQQFLSTNFKDRVSFNNATFKQEAQFLHCKLSSNSYISFQGATFNKGVDISRSNFNFGKTTFWDINIKDEGLLEDTFSSKYYENDFGDEKTLPSVPKKLRESMRFIKNSFSSENNTIEMLEFRKKEMNIYKEELSIKLRGTGKKNKKIEDNTPYIDIIAIIIMAFPLTVYVFNPETKFYFFAFTLLMGGYFYYTIKNSNITIDNIKNIYHSNKLVTGTIYSLIIITIFSYFLILYINPAELNYAAWVILGGAIIIALLIFCNLTKDNIILLFNKHSNNFGTSWVNGVVFTLLFTFITLSLMAGFSDSVILTLNERGVYNYFESFLYILNISPFNNDNTNYLFSDMGILTKITFFIGRIFIGYGIYQTIQAFRKYGKS